MSTNVLSMRPALLALSLLAVSVARPARADETPYELDAVSRTTTRTGRVVCPKLDLARYKGATLRYSSELAVHPAFAARLDAFERAVRDVAIEIYGRPPIKIDHLGTYSCRRINGYPELMSEHALGNAIDVEAFEFAALPKAERSASSLPPPLRGAFRVSVLGHWRATARGDALHRQFLHALVRRLVERDVFRVVLGPSYPGHANHLHLDMAPYRLVDAD